MDCFNYAFNKINNIYLKAGDESMSQRVLFVFVPQHRGTYLTFPKIYTILNPWGQRSRPWNVM